MIAPSRTGQRGYIQSTARLYLHIGTHTTGTTAVQRFFAANRDKLREAGVLYPEAGCPEGRPGLAHGQHLLPHAITRPSPNNAGAWDALHKELADSTAPTTFISSEEFDVLRDEGQFAELAHHLDGIPVTVIVYLRRQDEFLHSYYCTDVLWHRETRPFHAYRHTLKTNPNYRTLLSGWECAFGRQALRVRVYEEERLRNRDIVTDICREIGVEPGVRFFRPSGQREVNRAYPRNVIKCFLWARKSGMRDEDLESLRSLFALIYHDKRAEPDFLSPDERAALLREFATSNAEVARAYLGRSELFIPEIIASTDEWNLRYRRPLADLRASIDDAVESYRPEYGLLVSRVHEAVESSVPPDAKVLVVSRGDPELLAFKGPRGAHFPCDRHGSYAGYYPKDSEAAIAHVAELREQGATHLVLPRTAFWWLDYYEGLRKHLDSAHLRIRSDKDVIVYDLTSSRQAPEVDSTHRGTTANGGGAQSGIPLRGHGGR
jgi:hypothetical protein